MYFIVFDIDKQQFVKTKPILFRVIFSFSSPRNNLFKARVPFQIIVEPNGGGHAELGQDVLTTSDIGTPS
jgi:hypothetical protein